MIGNDIIDLSASTKESNWKRKGYLNKIYTESEQVLINTSTNPDTIVWLLWSIKEATYKANNRITKLKEYAPTKIECKINNIEKNLYWSTSSYNNLEYQIKSVVCNDYIHSIALYNANDFVKIEEIILNDYPVDYMQYLIANNYIPHYKDVQKDEFGVPNLYNKITKIFKPISISHHGNFLSLVYHKD